MTQRVEIVRKLKERGGKIIFVDGKEWGSIRMSMHGCWGSRYQFYQRVSGGGGGARNLIQEPPNERGWCARIEVSSNSKGRRATADDLQPLDERLMRTARELIERGLLRDPAIVDAEIAAANARYTNRLHEREAKQLAADTEKALALIAAHAPGLNDREPLARAIAAWVTELR